MLKVRLLFVFAFAVFYLNSVSQKQDNRILLTIDKQPVTVSEFMYVFNKNNGRGTTQDTTSLNEYLELYINFKLKVIEAEKLGMDTLATFRNELKGYRNQLAQPYLADKEVNDQLLREAYDRLQWNIRASHIMKLVPENMDDEDSVAKAAYNSLLEIRKRALKGENFAPLAREYSDDPSARDQEATRNFPARKGNGGDLGYFTSFYMVYPFESAAYNTEVGQISMPIRTRYGYHLVYVTDKIAALGTIHVAHILITSEDDEKLSSQASKAKADEVYNEITQGKISFENAAKKYSDDRGSADKGGELNWFEVNKMVPDFIKGISQIDQIGGISKPIKTDYGYHIIKLLDLKKVPSYEEYLPELKNKISKDTRSNKSKEVAVEKFKSDYKFKENAAALQAFYSVVDSSIFQKSWKADQAKSLTKTMFVLNKKKYSQTDFAKYIEENQRFVGKGTIKFIVHKLYNQWVASIVMAEKDNNLENEVFDFRMLVKEYHDGILLFNISDEMVWSKAIKDSAGLSDFHAQHQMDYQWKKRVDAEIYRVKNDSIALIVMKYLNQGLAYDSIIKLTNADSKLNLGIEKGKYEIGDHRVIDAIPHTIGLKEYKSADGLIYLVRVKEILEPMPKLLPEARGLITADYQNYLHDQWIKDLRAKYPIIINQKVFKTLE